MKARTKIIAGKKSHQGKYPHVALGEIVGKTIEAIGTTTVDSAYGDEPCTILYFKDGTQHGFVHPAE